MERLLETKHLRTYLMKDQNKPPFLNEYCGWTIIVVPSHEGGYTTIQYPPEGYYEGSPPFDTPDRALAKAEAEIDAANQLIAEVGTAEDLNT